MTVALRLASKGLVSALVVFCACKKDPAAEAQKELAPFRAKATAHVESLKKLAPAMRATPRVTKDGVSLDAGPVAIGDFESFDVTAGLLYEEDLGNVESWHTLEKWPAPKTGLFGQCASMLKGGGYAADHLKARLAKNCADAKYAIVVRTLERKQPVLRLAESVFIPGLQAGEVHVWNLESAKELGAFRFTAKNGDAVKARLPNVGVHDIEGDLAFNVAAEIRKGLEKFAR